jgi:hypothetical protein
METPHSSEGLVPNASDASVFQRYENSLDVLHGESRVRLEGRQKGIFHTDMKLPLTYFEPAAAAGAQWLRLFDFPQLQQTAEEAPRFSLASPWRRKLNMIDVDYQHSSIFLRESD